MHLSNSLQSLPLLTSTTLLLLSFITPAHSAYTLKDDYTPSTFFSQFTFFTDNDPTNGYVDYISQSAATSANLISTANNQIYMGVDSTNVASGRGRKSVRLTSKAVYNHALIILDLEHMPGSICGVWPAFWTVGPNWPTSGEIDIIEGVNGQVGNSMALHTGPGCSVSGTGSSSNTSPNTGSAQTIFSGTIKTADCNIAAAGQPTNAGCAITSSDASTYGSGLNAANGGVYATEWTSDVIRVWFFPRGQIPVDIDSGSPSPNSWGAPLSSFGGGSCNIDAAFKDQQIVFDTTFCGDWAGSVWSSDSMCSGKAATCQEYVQNNPTAFKDAFWTVNHLKVYTGDDNGGNGGAAPSASVSKSVGVSVSASVSMSMSRPVGSGLPSSQAPIGSVVPTTSSGFGKPVPGSTTTSGRGGQPPVATGTTAGPGAGTFAPPIATSQAPAPSQPQTPAPVQTQSQSQIPGNPIPTQNSNPVPVPTTPPTAAPAVPTTMATSRTNYWGGNGNSWSYSWGGNSGYTRTRGWNGPPRMAMAKWDGTGTDAASDTGADAGAGAVNVWEDVAAAHSRSNELSVRGSGATDTSVYEGENQVRSLIRPVIRRRDDEEEEQEQRERERREVRRQDHLGRHRHRHKERRWGHEHGRR